MSATTPVKSPTPVTTNNGDHDNLTHLLCICQRDIPVERKTARCGKHGFATTHPRGTIAPSEICVVCADLEQTTPCPLCGRGKPAQ